MDDDALRTASLYINNQLLSRGLLRDGQNIEFANPDHGANGSTATMGQIISVVNELLLRRDRDAELRESMAMTIRVLRADSLRQTDDVERLTERDAEARRKLALGDASEAALRAQLKAAEGVSRSLKDDMARARTLVAQTRAACATESRRRDRQIEALRKQLTEAGRARGTTRSPGVTVITIAGNIAESTDDTGASAGHRGLSGSVDSRDPAADDYDLRSETNTFLAELARSLSEENDQLVSIVRSTMQRLQRMSGWDGASSVAGDSYAQVVRPSCEDMSADMDAILEHLRAILTNPSFVPIEELVAREDEIGRLRNGWLKMESRWKEAVHLLDDWRKRMALNGRSVNEEELKMGLRLSPVRVRDVDETTHGYQLELPPLREEPESDAESEARSPIQRLLVSRSVRPPVPNLIDTRRLRYSQASEAKITQGVVTRFHHELDGVIEEDEDEDEDEDADEDEMDDIRIEDIDVDEPNVRILQQSTLLVEPLPLRNWASAANRVGPVGGSAPRPGISNQGPAADSGQGEEEDVWNLIGEEAVMQVDQENRTHLPSASASADSACSKMASVELSLTSAPVLPHDRPAQNEPKLCKATSPIRRNAQQPWKGVEKTRATTAPDATINKQRPQLTITATQNQTPRPRLSRLPLPRVLNNPPAPQQSPLTTATIAAKLAASERDADAARVRAKLKAVRAAATRGTAKQAPNMVPPPALAAAVEDDDNAAADPVKRDAAPPLSFPPTSSQQPQLPQQPVTQGHEELEQPARMTRKRDRKVSKLADRRRSTLNPWELESLIQSAAIPGQREEPAPS